MWSFTENLNEIRKKNQRVKKMGEASAFFWSIALKFQLVFYRYEVIKYTPTSYVETFVPF